MREHVHRHVIGQIREVGSQCLELVLVEQERDGPYAQRVRPVERHAHHDLGLADHDAALGVDGISQLVVREVAKDREPLVVGTCASYDKHW